MSAVTQRSGQQTLQLYWTGLADFLTVSVFGATRDVWRGILRKW